MLTAADYTVYTVPASMLFRPKSMYLETKEITGSGTAGALSVHAAAVVISRDPLTDHVPLQRPTRDWSRCRLCSLG